MSTIINNKPTYLFKRLNPQIFFHRSLCQRQGCQDDLSFMGLQRICKRREFCLIFHRSTTSKTLWRENFYLSHKIEKVLLLIHILGDTLYVDKNDAWKCNYREKCALGEPKLLPISLILYPLPILINHSLDVNF